MSISKRTRIVVAAVVLVAAAGFSTAQAGKIYWYGHHETSTGMLRANLDGTDVEMLLIGPTIGLAVDPVARKVYWGGPGSAGPTTVLSRANLDGSYPEELHDLEGALPDAIALDRDGGWVYLSANYLYDCNGVVRYRINGTGVAESIVPGVCAIGVAVDAGAGKLYWAEQSPNQAIRRANLDGSAPEIVIEPPDHPSALALDAARGKVYWSGNGVFRAGMDGTNVEALVPGGDLIGGIALDLHSDKLYWSSQIGLASIKRADLDGSNPETILDETSAYGQIAVDPVPAGPDVPAVSMLGVVALVLLLLAVATVALLRSRSVSH